MFAFWKYQGHLGCLGARIRGEIKAGGKVTPEGFGSMVVQPLILLPNEEGEEINAKLKALEQELSDKVRKLHKEYGAKAQEVAPFLKR